MGEFGILELQRLMKLSGFPGNYQVPLVANICGWVSGTDLTGDGGMGNWVNKGGPSSLPVRALELLAC